MTADNHDISYEKYFEDTDGAFIAALFYKDIKSFINTFKEDPFDFTGNGFTIPTEITVLVTDEEGEPLFNDDGSRLYFTFGVGITGAHAQAWP